MNHQRKLIALLIAATCTAASAGTVNPLRAAKSDVCGRFVLAHINGVMTSPTDAADNLSQLQLRYGNAYSGHLLNYGLAYNQERGAPTDWYQAVMAIIKGIVGAAWSSYYNAVQSAIYTSGMPKTTAASISKTVDDAFGLTKPTPYQDADLASIKADLTRMVSPGARLVIVAHSQGNLYANLVYDQLIAAGTLPASSIGVVGVAVPYFSVRGGGPSVISSRDLVIDSARLLVQVLPSNVTIPSNYAVDVYGHNFVDTYLADPNARTMIINGIFNTFNKLKTTIKLGTANTGTSRFSGSAAWADCTVPDMSKWPWWPPADRASVCGFGGSAVQYFGPMVFYRVAGQTSQITAAGDASQVPGLAIKQRDACIAQGASYWATYVATGAVAGTSGNCGSTYNIELAGRYRDLKSGDDGKTTSWSKTWTATSIGIGPYAEGGTDEYTGPTCRN